jgi:RimJ/RimL family protein N-acetyltransferase
VKLETARLVIREREEGDLSAVMEYASDPETVKYLEWGPNTESQSREFISRCRASAAASPRDEYDLAVALRDGGKVVGGCRITVDSRGDRRASLGYVLSRGFWGQGYATEAVRALVGFGFESLKMHRIMATAHPDNRASGRVLEKVGFRYEGRRREDKLVRGEWRDSLVFSMLEQDWEKRKAG